MIDWINGAECKDDETAAHFANMTDVADKRESGERHSDADSSSGDDEPAVKGRGKEKMPIKKPNQKSLNKPDSQDLRHKRDTESQSPERTVKQMKRSASIRSVPRESSPQDSREQTLAYSPEVVRTIATLVSEELERKQQQKQREKKDKKEEKKKRKMGKEKKKDDDKSSCSIQ